MTRNNYKEVDCHVQKADRGAQQMDPRTPPREPLKIRELILITKDRAGNTLRQRWGANAGPKMDLKISQQILNLVALWMPKTLKN